MSELSRVEDLLKTGVEEPVLPMSRLEAILRGEKITPQSRVEELLLQYNPSDILIEKRITANGTYFAVNDNADGYFKVVVDTPVTPSVVLDHLVETITTNGLHEYTPTHDGFDTAAITVAVPIPPEKILGTKTITENDTYDASDDSTEVTVTLDNPSIPDNSFIHVDISDIADVTKMVGKVSYTMTSVDRAFTVDISNIPTYTPSGSNPYQNMYCFDSYNYAVNLYISKDATGIFLYNMNEGWVRPVIYEFGYKETKQLDGYSQVTVNVQPTLDDITITENGIYTSEHDGFDEVTVNVSGGGPSGDINIKCAPLAWDNTVEGSVASCGISVVNNKLTYTWNGGEYITANSVYTVPVSKDASKVRFNITTGTSYYSTYSQLDRFKVRVGVRTVFDNGSINTDNINDWIDVEAFATANSTFEGELDLSNLNTDGYIYIVAHGWNLVVNSVDVLYNTTVMLDPNYNYYTAKDGQIIVRVYHEGKSDEKIVWFFNGLEKTSSDLTVPSNLLAYAPPSGFSESVASQAMSPTKNESTYNYWIGWAHSLGNGVIRSWTNDWTATAQGTFWAVVDLDNGDEQTNKYTDPYVYIEEGDSSLLYLGYGEQTATDDNWTEGTLPIDTINKASSFDDYLEYNATTKYFTCKLDFDALIVFWVYNLHSSDNRPQVILSDSNNSPIESITTTSTSAGAKGGSGIIVRMSAGYSFKFINPEPKGWGFVRAKFYKVVDTTVYDFEEP